MSEEAGDEMCVWGVADESWCRSVCEDSLAGLVGAGLEDGRDGVSVADGAEVFFAGRLRHRERKLVILGL